MINRYLLVLALLVPALLSAQDLPSVSFLRSGFVLGTGRDRHFSLRMEALGLDFSGFLTDQVTDLYRNPAYFNKIENPLIFGELARPQYGLTPVVRYEVPVIRLESDYQGEYPFYLLDPRGSVQFYPPDYSASSPIGIRFGYANRFGIFIRGNYT